MSKASASELREAIQKQANPKVASGQQRYFKTGPGEYGDGDKFLGLNVPIQRKIANEFIDISLKELQGIVSDEFHEIRSIGMIILTEKIQSTKSQIEKDKIFNFYIQNKQFCNNWDLVDVSCTKIFDGRIVGNDLLNDLSKSESLWDRRISIVSTLSEIRKGNYEPTLRIASVLLQDSQDLIHKAVGWMLREVGKRNKKTLIDFITKYANKMHKTTFRYCTERLSKAEVNKLKAAQNKEDDQNQSEDEENQSEDE